PRIGAAARDGSLAVRRERDAEDGALVRALELARRARARERDGEEPPRLGAGEDEPALLADGERREAIVAARRRVLGLEEHARRRVLGRVLGVLPEEEPPVRARGDEPLL